MRLFSMGRSSGNSLGNGTSLRGRQNARVELQDRSTLSVFNTCVGDSLDVADPTFDPLGAHVAVHLKRDDTLDSRWHGSSGGRSVSKMAPHQVVVYAPAATSAFAVTVSIAGQS
jgi:hypothetical protein